MTPLDQAVPLLEARDICKSFGAIRALTGVNLSIRQSRVHGLVGANGAGKSTLLNIFGGVLQPSSGTVLLDGAPQEIASPRRASELGFSFIYQELALIPDFPAWENMTLRMRSLTPFGLGDEKMRKRAAQEVADRLHLKFSLDTPVRRLSVAERGLVAIGRALIGKARFIAMDEPTAALSDVECDRLFQIVNDLVASGVAVAYVSHRLDEIEQLCDDVTIFKNGATVASFSRGGYDRQDLIEGIIGQRDAASADTLRRTASAQKMHAEVILSASGLSAAPLVRDASIDLYSGEVVGLAGLVGAGRTEFLRLLFGAERPTAGTMQLYGQRFSPVSPIEAIRHGLALVPEERRSQGLVMEESLAFNASMGNTKGFLQAGFPIMDDQKIRTETSKMMARLNVKASSCDVSVRSLSGGNQQKIVLARWLLRNSRILLLDEPSRGVDVGARKQIWQSILGFADSGGAALVISSELEELEACDRVVVMVEGRTVGTLKGSDVTEAKMLEMIYRNEDTHIW